jgi:radical SAM protein with 4Fe4S-binding SPASM domain
VNTQVNRASMPELEALYALIAAEGIHSWQVQLTVPMGNAADRPELLLQPYELLELFPLLARLAERGVREGVRLRPGNNLGYFGPYEALLRGAGNAAGHWGGCQAGVQVLGIEADGAIKGCPSLPTTPYTGGNIRDMALDEIIMATAPLAFNREAQSSPEAAVADLWGFCRGCYYAELCRGGCTWTSHVTLGKRGNNPYCHHRALEMAKAGKRERLVPAEAAPGLPFDYGRFELVEEAWPAGEAAPA